MSNNTKTERLAEVICKDCHDIVIVKALDNWCPRCRFFVDNNGTRMVHVSLTLLREMHALLNLTIRGGRDDRDVTIQKGIMLQKLCSLRDQCNDVLLEAEGDTMPKLKQCPECKRHSLKFVTCRNADGTVESVQYCFNEECDYEVEA